jgi:hypothetical protein
VKSKWVSQEIYESLYLELAYKKVKLIPCLVEKCHLPLAFTKTKKLSRIYADLENNYNEAVENIIKTLDGDPYELFEVENYAILEIPHSSLTIYLTGEIYSRPWEINEDLRYVETIDSYLLFSFHMQSYTNFKHFVLCELSEGKKVKDKLDNLGYIVTGSGDIDKQTGKRRVWFNIPESFDFSNCGFTIDENHNQWT